MSAAQSPDLIIPVRFDLKDVPQQLNKVGAAGKSAGDETAKGFRRAEESTKSFRDQLVELGKAQIVLSGVRELGNAARLSMQQIGESAQDARRHIKGLVDEMEAARTASREIAALRGKEPTAAITAEMAWEAAGAGVSPEEHKQFALGFEAYSGQYVGEDGATPEKLAKQGKRISKDQAQALQQQVAGYSMGARGLSADDSAQLLGLIIAKSKAGTSNEEIMGNYAKLMKVAELAPGRTSPLLGQITELGMENVGRQGDLKSVLQAGYLTRVMAQCNPAEASTYGRALMRGLREIRGSDEKMSELGLTKDMDFFQQLTQIDKKVKEATAAGQDQGQFLSKYFKDIREWGGISTAINEGIRVEGFQRAQQEAEGVNAETVDRERHKYLAGQEGRAARDRARETAIARERAGRYAELRHWQSKARKSLVSSGDLEIPEGMVETFLTKGGAAFGQGLREEQEERALVAKDLRERLSGAAQGRVWLDRDSHALQLACSRTVPEATLAAAANELKRIREMMERQEKERGQRQQPPISAPPPRPPGRM
jgi:hypothetical protein